MEGREGDPMCIFKPMMKRMHYGSGARQYRGMMKPERCKLSGKRGCAAPRCSCTWPGR